MTSGETQTTAAEFRAAQEYPRSAFSRWRLRVRQLKQSAAGFDLKWIKILACVLTLSVPAWGIPNITVHAVMPWVAMTAALLAAAYYGHILFFRLQCSLLEFCVIIAALGNLEGALLTTPAIFSVGREWAMVLAPLSVAWLFYGAVIGRVQAELCGRRSAPARLFYIVAGWLSTGSIAMVALGAILWIGQSQPRLVTKNLAAWVVPLLIAGVIGAVLGIWFGRAAKRAAREIVYAPNTSRT